LTLGPAPLPYGQTDLSSVLEDQRAPRVRGAERQCVSTLWRGRSSSAAPGIAHPATARQRSQDELSASRPGPAVVRLRPAQAKAAWPDIEQQIAQKTRETPAPRPGRVPHRVARLFGYSALFASHSSMVIRSAGPPSGPPSLPGERGPIRRRRHKQQEWPGPSQTLQG